MQRYRFRARGAWLAPGSSGLRVGGAVSPSLGADRSLRYRPGRYGALPRLTLTGLDAELLS